MSQPSQYAKPTPLDSRVRVVTPENIAFEYRAAGPFARIGAYLLDLMILAGTMVGLSVLFTILGSAIGLPGISWMAILILGFVAYWFYGGLFEWLWNGQTPGKRMTGLRVLRTDGRPIAVWQAVLRNLLRYIDLFPYATLTDGFDEGLTFFWPTCLIGLTAMACTARYQRIGDLACNTMVVAEEPTGSSKAAKDWMAASGATRDPALRQVLDALPASYRPSRTLSRALSHYIARRRYFGPARRREIAQYVGVVVAEQLNLPTDIDHDLLLCALYVRVFLTESEEAMEEELSASPNETTTHNRLETEPRFLPTEQGSPASQSAAPADPQAVPGSPEYAASFTKPSTPTP